MNFKQAILQDLIFTYREADEIKVYEDRPKQLVLPAMVYIQISTSDYRTAPVDSVNFSSNLISIFNIQRLRTHESLLMLPLSRWLTNLLVWIL